MYAYMFLEAYSKVTLSQGMNVQLLKLKKNDCLFPMSWNFYLLI